MQLVQMVLASIGPLPPQNLAWLCQTNRGLYTAGRLEGHVNGIWFPVATQVFCCLELDRVRYGPSLSKGGGVCEWSMGQIQQVLHQQTMLNFHLYLQAEDAVLSDCGWVKHLHILRFAIA